MAGVREIPHGRKFSGERSLEGGKVKGARCFRIVRGARIEKFTRLVHERVNRYIVASIAR